MTLPETDIENEFIEDSPGWTSDHQPTPPPPSDLPSPAAPIPTGPDRIGKSVDAIISGERAGQHEALDKLIGPQNKHWPETVCSPNCPNRHGWRPTQAAANTPTGPLISDVTPPVDMRVYGLEKDMGTLQRDFAWHRDESIRASGKYATKEKLHDLELGISKDMGRLEAKVDRRTVWQVFQTAALVVSTAYGLILSYKHFIQP